MDVFKYEKLTTVSPSLTHLQHLSTLRSSVSPMTLSLPLRLPPHLEYFKSHTSYSKRMTPRADFRGSLYFFQRELSAQTLGLLTLVGGQLKGMSAFM